MQDRNVWVSAGAMARAFSAVAVVSLASCGGMPALRDPTLPAGAVCRSLDGRPLALAPLADAFESRQNELLAAARAELAERPNDREAAIWVGRRLGYLGRYHDAIDVYTEALERHPDDPFLLRHRGHRHLSVRAIDRAITDLTRAAVGCRTEPDQTEPDGLPTPGRPPHSSLHFNVHYHLGLAHFVARDFAAAEAAWLDCLAVTDDDESRVAVTHWLWSVRMRLGDTAGAAAVVAPITPAMDVVENTSYHRLCLLYAGRLTRAELAPGDGSSGAALAFGLAHHALVTGDRAAAQRGLEELAARPGWAAFGVLAAEAELAGW